MNQSVKTNSLHLCMSNFKNIGHNLDSLVLNYSAKDGCGGQVFGKENLPSTTPFSKWSALSLQRLTHLETLSAKSSAEIHASFDTCLNERTIKNNYDAIDYSNTQKYISSTDVNVLLQRCTQFHTLKHFKTQTQKYSQSLFQKEITIQDKTVLG